MVDKRFRSFHKAPFAFKTTTEFIPISCMHVFNHIDAAVRHCRIERVKGRRNIAHDATSIVQDGIERLKLFHNLAEESGVRLIADANVDLIPQIPDKPICGLCQ